MLLKNIDSEVIDIEGKIRIVIENTLSRCSIHDQRKVSKIVSKAVQCTKFMNGLIRDNLRSLARDKLKLVFLPHNILKKMDTSLGVLNFTSLEILHEVENKNEKKYYQGILPSRKMIYAVQQQLHSIGDVINPFKIEEGKNGESIIFDKKKIVPLLFKTYGIHNEAMKYCVQLSLTCDGTDVTNNLSQIIQELKMIHNMCINPLNGTSISPQIRNVCQPTQIIMGRKTKKMYKNHIVLKFEVFHGAEIIYNDSNSLLFP